MTNWNHKLCVTLWSSTNNQQKLWLVARAYFMAMSWVWNYYFILRWNQNRLINLFSLSRRWIVCMCWLVKSKPKRTLWISPGGVECGHCVAHWLSLLLNFTMWWKDEVKCTLILEKWSKDLQDCRERKGMKEGLFGVMGDSKLDFWAVCPSPFIKTCWKPASKTC